MIPRSGEEELFPFLSPQHPFRPQLQRFEALIRAGPGFPSADGTASVHTDLKASPAEDGGFRIETFYCSVQSRTERRFAASTLSYSAKRGEAGWLEFPADPYLTAVAEYFAASASPPEVLRYVPLRRLTFLERDASGRTVVGKFKRRSRFREAYVLLKTVHRELARAGLPFRVPAPLGMDEARGLYFQEALPGRNLAQLLADNDDAPAQLRRLGALHAALHRAPADALPLRSPDAWLSEGRRDAAWIAFLLPEHADAIARAHRAIETHAEPVQGGTPGFCHGDPDCGQVLVDGSDWALLDFDGCHAGDPYRDLAMLIASLDYHVPRFEALAQSDSAEADIVLERSAASYLDGYFAAAGGRADARRLAWHQACAELYYLALVLKKDRWRPHAFERRWRRLQAHIGRLGAPT